ncbi:MAG: TonB family protein [Prevotellaceae bacterium]|jgi:TonB family protein|nr:TonB family protein [Prevotellaceae bacterium]
MDTPQHTVNHEKFDAIFNERRSFRQWIRDNLIGLYITLILHLMVFLVMAVHKIRQISPKRFVAEIVMLPVENDKTEEMSKEEAERIRKELDEMLKDMKIPNIAANMAVSGSKSGRGGENVSFFSTVNTSTLKEKQDKERQKQENRLAKSGVDDVPTATDETTQSGQAYRGPSVLSYWLDGRVALPPIPVPAYKCLNGGDVMVLIEVDKLGYVVNTSVNNATSSKDECLRDAALQAAKEARFSPADTPGLQKGNIVYRFISQ